jgi:hypothetical protein
MQPTEDEKEVPDANANLHRIGIAVTIIRGVGETNVGLRRYRHQDLLVGKPGVKQ